MIEESLQEITNGKIGNFLLEWFTENLRIFHKLLDFFNFYFTFLDF